MGAPQRAAGHLLQAIGLQFHRPEAHYHLGTAYGQLGHYAEAAQAYEV